MKQHVTHFTADWFTEHAPHWLEMLGHLRDMPAKVLEVGSYEGRSACWMMDNLLLHPDALLLCVDVWDGKDPCLGDKTLTAEQAFMKNVRWYGKRVQRWKGPSVSAMSCLYDAGKWYDLVFVDGNHEGSAALLDLLLAWELLHPGGYLVMDDYGWSSPLLRSQPADAWNAFVSVRPKGLHNPVLRGRMMFAQKKGVPLA